MCLCVGVMLSNQYECDCFRDGKGGGEPADREQTAPGDQVRDMWMLICVCVGGGGTRTLSFSGAAFKTSLHSLSALCSTEMLST